CDQNHVALAQRNVELLGETQQHFARCLRAASLKKTQMTGRDLGLARELKLAHPALAAPFAQMFAGRFTVWLHGGKIVTRRGAIHYLRGNGHWSTTIHMAEHNRRSRQLSCVCGRRPMRRSTPLPFE